MQISDETESGLSGKERSLANLKPFTAGVSGNPLGKPPGTKHRSTILKELMTVELSAKGLDGAEGKFSAEYLVNAALLKKAMDGDIPAIKELQDTLYGKLTDKIGGDPELPLVPTTINIQLIKPDATENT